MTDKLNLQRLDHDPRLPMRGSIDFERVLYVRLYELFRTIAGVTNQNGEAISDAISNVTTQLTEDINQAITGVTNQIDNKASKNANLSDLTNKATARDNLGLGSAATADIVGAMASGAIIESGENHNGQYIKFADGTMVCGFEFQISGTGWKTTRPTINFAASFVANPLITYSFISDDTAWSGAASIYRSTRGTGSFQIRPPIGITDTGTSVNITGVAFGRWKD